MIQQNIFLLFSDARGQYSLASHDVKFLSDLNSKQFFYIFFRIYLWYINHYLILSSLFMLTSNRLCVMRALTSCESQIERIKIENWANFGAWKETSIISAKKSHTKISMRLYTIPVSTKLLLSVKSRVIQTRGNILIRWLRRSLPAWDEILSVMNRR